MCVHCWCNFNHAPERDIKEFFATKYYNVIWYIKASKGCYKFLLFFSDSRNCMHPQKKTFIVFSNSQALVLSEQNLKFYEQKLRTIWNANVSSKDDYIFGEFPENHAFQMRFTLATKTVILFSYFPRKILVVMLENLISLLEMCI